MNLLINTPEEVTIQNLGIRGETGSLEETAMGEALGKGHCSGWTEWHIPPSSSTLENGNPTGEQSPWTCEKKSRSNSVLGAKAARVF